MYAFDMLNGSFCFYFYFVDVAAASGSSFKNEIKFEV